jgi:hypothetical protein
MGEQSMEEPTRFDQRIGDYMETMRLSLEARKALWGKLACQKSLFGRTIRDIFLCNGAPGSVETNTQSLWLFTSDVASELRDGVSYIEIDFSNHKDVQYVKLTARESDLFSVGSNSSMTMHVGYVGGRTSTLVAHGENCLQLMIMFKKYFSRHLSP